jgi:hypothetical protein
MVSIFIAWRVKGQAPSRAGGFTSGSGTKTTLARHRTYVFFAAKYALRVEAPFRDLR